jgi:general secretion pathway protein F
MPQFRYVAVNAAGETQRGTVDAASEAAVIDWLQRQGSVPLRAEPAGGRAFLADLFSLEFGRGGALTWHEMIDVTRELSIMLGAGQDLDRALRILAETAVNARVRAVMEKLRNTVRDGGSLAAALAQHPRSFSPLYVGLVRAGEAGGTLGPTLDRLAALLERQRSLAATVRSALVYPALLLVAAIGSIVLMLTQVLPQFVPLFAQNGVALPRSTQLLVGAGAFVTDYGVVALILVLLLVLAARVALRRQGVRRVVDRLVLRLPIAGSLSRDILAARFTRIIGTLLANGVPLIPALDIVRGVLGNLAAIEAVDRATVGAKGGAGLAASLAETGIFPERTVHLLRLGEENARLAEVALRAAEIHEEKTRLGVQQLVSLLGPTITILMGAAIAAIVASLLSAMLSLNSLAG